MLFQLMMPNRLKQGSVYTITMTRPAPKPRVEGQMVRDIDVDDSDSVA